MTEKSSALVSSAVARVALDRAAYALFQIKRLVDAGPITREHAREAHAEACKALDELSPLRADQAERLAAEATGDFYCEGEQVRSSLKCQRPCDECWKQSATRESSGNCATCNKLCADVVASMYRVPSTKTK